MTGEVHAEQGTRHAQPERRRTIALVDDDRNILTTLSILLQSEGFATRVYSDGDTALGALLENPPDLAIFDIKMPRMSGLELLERFRDQSNVPVIFLTSRDEEPDEALGLALGADDYITKPFSPRELVARLKAVLRRATPMGVEETIEVNGLILDPVCHRVMSDDSPVDVGPTEYRLLQFFMTHQERAYSRSQLLDQVWGGNVYVEERTVDVHIRRLRKALGATHEHLIQTVRGTGYRFSTKAS